MATTYIIEPHDRLGVVYGLHSGDGVIRYVGKTLRLKARMTEHLIHSRDGKPHNLDLAEWLNSIETLHVAILENGVSEIALDDAERSWITRLGLPNLLNLTTNAARVENRVYAGQKRGRQMFDAEAVARIRERVANGETRVAVARDLGVHRDTICQIASGRTYPS